MGAWGPGIFSDDTAADVRDEFKELIGDGLEAGEATRRLVAQWAETIADADEGPVFWLALAGTQAGMGRLQDEVRDRALRVIDSGDDLRRWEDDAPPADVAKRRANLAKLRDQLTGAQKQPTKVRKEYVERTEWRPRQHWAYRLPSGHWIVLRVVGLDDRWSRGVLPIVAVLDEVWSSAPTLDDALRATPRTHLGYGYSLDDRSRPADALILARMTKRDFPTDRLALLGEGDPARQRWSRWKERKSGDAPARIPHLTFWRVLDDELAEWWRIT